MTTNTKLTDKNTKNEFMAEYKRQLQVIEDLQSQLSDPSKIVTAKKTEETLNVANQVVKGDIGSIVNQLQTEVINTLSNLTEKVTKSSEELVSLEDAIKIKSNEVKELFDIEKNAYTLTALINTEKTMKIKFEEDKKEREKQLNQIVDGLNSQINDLKLQLVEQLKAVNDQVEDTRKKALNEWNYELARKKQVDNDNWSDDKKKRESELAEKEKELANKLAAVEEREEKIEELEAKVEEIPSLIEEAKLAAYEEGKSKAEKNAEYAKRAIEANCKAEKSILENKVSMYEDTIKKQTAEIDRLNKDLKEAYSKIQETAKATVEAQANARMVSSFESIAREKNTQK